MTIFLTVIHIIVCLILILVILLQAGRGQGLTGVGFGSGNVQSLFGTRAADFLTKATSVAAICFLFTCIGLNILETQKSRSLFDASQKEAPVDIETIKKALEKIKAEKGTETTPADSKTETPASATAPADPTQNRAAPVASQTSPPPSQTASGEASKNSPSTASHQIPGQPEATSKTAAT